MPSTLRPGEVDGDDDHGRLVGRTRHVLPDGDGDTTITWADELPVLRRQAEELADRLGRAPLVAGWAGLPVLARVAVAVVAGRRGGPAALGPRLRRLFLGLGPTWIKFGQMISGGVGVFPQELVDEFAEFRDRLPAEPFSHVRAVVERELPGGMANFATFDAEPLAAASIAQVHAATLADGRAVVVKVQRPDVRERIVADLRWMSVVARVVDRIPSARPANLPGIVAYFASTLAEEIDFRLEAENMIDVAEAVSRSEHATGVAVPRPHPHLVTARVLVMERFHGFDSTDGRAVADAGIDTEAMLMAGFSAFVEGALIHGVFHGDLHPGNVMVLPDGRYGILDYGIVGRLSPADRNAFARMMACGAACDLRGQIEAMRDLSGFPPGADVDALLADVPPELFPTDLRVPDLSTMSGSLRSTVTALRRHGFRLPKLLVLLSKNLLFAADSLERFAPDLDLMAAATPLFVRAAAAGGTESAGAADAAPRR